MKLFSITCSLILFACNHTASAQSSDQTSGKLQISEVESAIEIRFAGKPILTYNKISPPLPDGIAAIYQRSGFLHPVASPSGRVVTGAFAADHPHQNGIFTAWVMTKWNDRPIDFWNLGKGVGRVSHQQVVQSFAEPGKIGFVVELVHTAEEKPVVEILRERWKVTAWETDGSYHKFDLETTQTALTDSPLTIEKYHYGGVGYRGPVEWLSDKEAASADADPGIAKRQPFQFINDRGSDRIEGNEEHARWVSATGQIDGRMVSVTVLCHESNFRSPQAARLHPTKPYFAYSPCLDGTFTIDRQNEYRATFRYLVTDAAPDEQWIKGQWDQWHGK